MSTLLDAIAAAVDNDPIDSPDFKLPKWVATRRVKALLEKMAAANGYDLEDKNSGAISFLANEAGIAPRLIYRMLHEESNRTSFDNLERIINHTNQLDLRWTPKEGGGFADVFNGEPQEIPEPTEKQKAYWKAHRESRDRRQAQKEAAQKTTRRRAAKELAIA